MVSQLPPRMDRALSGGHIQRLAVGRVGARDVALFQVRVPGETVYVLIANGYGVGLIEGGMRTQLREAMRGTALADQAGWRSRVEGARIAHIDGAGMDFVRDGSAYRTMDGEGRTLVVALDPSDRPPVPQEAIGWDALEARGRRIAAELLRADASGRSEGLGRALAKAIGRVDRRIQALGGDLAKMDAAEQAGRLATLFVAEAARAPRGATTLCATDWSNGTPQTLELKLNAAKSAHEQITATFKRARRMKEGAAITLARLCEANEARATLGEVESALKANAPDISALEARARAAAPRDFKLASGSRQGPVRPRQDAARPPYRKFIGASGLAILVGRGAAHNDALTMHVARPHDLWLHAKAQTGAHVVVPLNKGASCPPDLLVEAAHLAAHFSDARDERVVDVSYTPRRYVRKPRASAPGAVAIEREKVLVLRKSDDLLRKLLASEAEIQPHIGACRGKVGR